MAEPVPVIQSFDGVASRYDATFTDQQLGRWLRNVAWKELSSVFNPGDTVLDLGCGTGEDACYLGSLGINVLATDVSSRMLDVARSKAQRRGVSERISLAHLDLREVSEPGDLAPLSFGDGFDGAYANFGPLNCLADRRPLARALAGIVKPGGALVAVVMSPVCPWEIGWFLIHGHPRAAARRFRKGVRSRVGTGEIRVWYPSPRRLRSELKPEFVHVKTMGMGIFLPPSDFGHLVQRAPRGFTIARSLEDRVRGNFPWTWINDHYLSVFKRRDEV